MALPTLVKTWQISSNNRIVAPNDETQIFQELLFGVKEALVGFGSNPWTVPLSSDSVEVVNGDLWAVSEDLVWDSPGDPHSWIVLENVEGVQILLDLINSSTQPHRMDAFASLSAGFSGGTASNRATASDEFRLDAAGGLDSTGVFPWARSNNSGDIDKIYNVWHANDGTATRVIIFEAGDGVSYWEISKLIDPRANHTVPYVVGLVGSNSDILGSPLTNDNGRLYSREGDTSFEMSYYGRTNSADLIIDSPEASVAEELDGDPFLDEVGVVGRSGGGRGPKGRVPDLWWGQHQLVNTGDQYPGDGTGQLVQLNKIVCPWDGTVLETS